MTNIYGNRFELNEYLNFDDAVEAVKWEVDRTLSTSPKIIRQYTQHLVVSRGKFIRTLSLLACAQKEDKMIHRNAVNFAAAVELLHLATLVHDDVIDDADLRRGEITLQKKFGKKTAVICGDYLLAVSLELAASVSDKEDYLKLNMPSYVSKVCLGELNQHLNNHNIDLGIMKYLRIISGKTAALFEASFYAGAVLSETDPKRINRYRKLGNNIGMLFQLTDDCMDFEETTEVAKKPVESDYEQGVITLPLIYALKKDEVFKKKAEGKLSRSDINSAVKKTGGLDFTHMLAEKYYKKSLKIIADLELEEDKANKLKFVLDKSYRLI